MPGPYASPLCITRHCLSVLILKQASRTASSLLHSAATAGVLSALAGRASAASDTSPPPSPALLQPLREANGLAQHHDAITGTAKLPVLKDYLLQLSEASNAVVEELARSLIVMARARDAENVTAAQLSAFTGWADLPLAAGRNSAVLRPIIVYNSLLLQRNVLVVIRTTSSTLQPPLSPSSPPPTGLFTDADGNPIPCEAVPCSATPACPTPDGYLLHAQIDVPALGFTTVFINNTGNCDILQPQNASWIEYAANFFHMRAIALLTLHCRYLSTSSLVVSVTQVGGDNGTHVLHSIQRPSGETLLPSMSLKSLTSNGDGA